MESKHSETDKRVHWSLNPDDVDHILLALSEYANERLRDAGAALDRGDDEGALDCFKVSRAFHKLHKDLHQRTHGFNVPIL